MTIKISLITLLLLTSGLHASQKNWPTIYQGESCYLHELTAKRTELAADNFKKATDLLAEMKRQELKDPTILALPLKDSKKNMKIAGRYHPPFDFNRSGRAINGLFISASDVHTRRQNYILGVCPQTLQNVQDYFEAALAQNTTVFVSALASREAKSRKNNFWKNKTIKKLTLRDGTTIKRVSSEILQTRIKHGIENPDIYIKERKLACSNGKMLTHLHYEGWRDKRPIPSKKLLTKLLDRIYELNQDPTIPIAINCRGGVGRTGTIAVSLFLRRELDAQLALGTPLDEIKVNIPRVIYKFRKQRKSIVGNPQQLAQIYAVLASYYKQKQKEINAKI